MQKIITLKTNRHNGLYDITSEVEEIISTSKVQTGIVFLLLKFKLHYLMRIVIQY